MDIFEHPGNLGATRGTILTMHHADWPAYPQGDDFHTPLLQLTAFPPGTDFVVVDDIDQSFLLVADVEGKKLHDPYNERNFHVAIWYEDLRALHDRGMIDGVEQVSERRWQEEHWKRLRRAVPDGATIGYKGKSGEFIPIREPDFTEYEDEFRQYIISTGRRLRITDVGRRTLLAELRKDWTDLQDDVGERVAHLFELAYYDTAIREACVCLEHEIRKYLGSILWGNPLVEECVSKLRGEKKLLESYLRTFRQELRTIFKFIRNDFMHNLREADEVAAYAMLFRIARARAMLKIAST
jgi:hypothetical protein